MEYLKQETKPFRLGIMVGRFQTLHLGHEDMIRTAAALCDRLGIFIGSSQESGTAKNPFSYELRKELLETVLDGRAEIYPLPDIGVGNNCAWGNYVLENTVKCFGCRPDLLASGKESRRLDWFDEVNGVNIAELYIPKTIDISATEMREHFARNDIKTWRSFTDPLLWPRYEELRSIVLASRDNLETKSI